MTELEAKLRLFEECVKRIQVQIAELEKLLPNLRLKEHGCG